MEKKDIDAFKHNVGRFMAEYGFQSYPSMETILHFTDSSHFSLTDSIMINRQKSYIGNGMIEDQINKFLSPAHSFEDFIEKVKSSIYGIEFRFECSHQQTTPLHGHLILAAK